MLTFKRLNYLVVFRLLCAFDKFMIWMILHVGLILDVFLEFIVLFIVSVRFEILFYKEYS